MKDMEEQTHEDPSVEGSEEVSVSRLQLIWDVLFFQVKLADTPNDIGSTTALNFAVCHCRMPTVMAIEVTQHLPHRIYGCIQDSALDDLDHGFYPPKCRFNASKPP